MFKFFTTHFGNIVHVEESILFRTKQILSYAVSHSWAGHRPFCGPLFAFLFFLKGMNYKRWWICHMVMID